MTTTAHTAPAADSSRDTTDGPPVVVRVLRQHYGDFEAVKGVSFDIHRGELFSLLGTNGAGKTTTVDTLEGFRRPSSGSVRVFGVDSYGQPAGVREHTNAVLQGSGLMEDLSVQETVDLARDLPAEPRTADEVPDMVQLSDKRPVRIRQLSGGRSAAWTWRWRSSPGPGCCTWTSPPRVWTPRRGTRRGGCSPT